MLVHRRITLTCAIAALAVAPSSALAMPATDPPPPKQPAAPIVREVHVGEDTTLALVLSGSALLVAAAAAGLSGHDHRRLGKVA